MSTAALFTIAKIWKQSKCPLTDGLELTASADGPMAPGGRVGEGELGSFGVTRRLLHWKRVTSRAPCAAAQYYALPI